MILGVCCGTDENTVKMMKEIGYRYLEGGIYGFQDRAKLDETLRVLDKYKIRLEVGQHPFVGEYDPSGEQSKEALEKVRDYMYKLIKSTSDLNIEKLVMGAGGARVLPSPDKYENVIQQMADICKYGISPVLNEFGIILTLEGLRKNETPMMNRTDESVTIAKLANVPNIKVMADLYHVAHEDTSLADFVNYKG
jgi:sugar phosphate isomerase/epimerase